MEARPILVILPFCAKDRERTVRLAGWIAELGGVSRHDCLLAVHTDTTSAGVIEPLRTAFRRVAEFPINDDVSGDPSQYVIAANTMWRRTVNHVADMNEPAAWFWLEPDAVPLCAEWLDLLEAEYRAAEKPFLHELVQAPTALRNSGIGIYPARVRDYTDKLWELNNVAWDVLLSPDFLPHTHNTRLIQDSYWMSRDPDKAPEFPDDDSLSFIRPGVVLFHRSKGGSLIQRLRNRQHQPVGDGAAASAPVQAGDKVVEPSLTPPRQPEESLLKMENALLLERIKGLEELLGKNGDRKPKKKRSAIEQARINVRMAKLRERKLVKA